MVSARTFTVTNNCAFTIWPAIFTDPNVGSATPDYATGWEAAPQTTVSFSVPNTWQAGRIWARRDCDFSDTNPATQCADGGCAGGLECTGAGSGPVTVAEFSLGVDEVDYVDVSLVDGFNLPIAVNNDKGCPEPSCPVDLNANCPAALAGPLDSTGNVVGCKSACEVDPNPGNSQNCCTGSYNTAATCPASRVQYYSYFKSNCPNALAFAYDESPSLLVCSASQAANYQVTFCPAN
ncbi:thaumatin-like protein [Phanerochaete sordida]|uniref:Thaumatin-like protein n=1 Tax=Phanerochaete sordida TaxID=48140 RepID=A0A9P3GAP5_9APHY|nr:thaumatin-like protein [Phanerochaete sordida]